jgi:hypothetical protein
MQSARLKWIGAALLLAAAMVIGALGYETDDSTASAIGYGFGIGLVGVSLTALGRFLYLRSPSRRGEPMWTPAVLAIAGAVSLFSIAAISAADTQDAHAAAAAASSSRSSPQ